MEYSIKLVIAIVVILSMIGIILWKKSKRSNVLGLAERKVDNLQMNDIASWFKQAYILDKLKENSELTAIAIRCPHPMAKDLAKEDIMVIVFNEKKSEIIEGEIFHYNEVSNEIVDSFGDTDMIVLK